MDSANCFADPKLGSISSLRCQKSRMTCPVKDNACEAMFRGRLFRSVTARGPSSPFGLRRDSLRHDRARLAVAGAASEGWWSQTGSNRRPHACKARALPAELWPRNQKTNAQCRDNQHEVQSCPSSLSRASPGTLRSTPERGGATRSRKRSVVGLGRLELPTSRLSSARSNQLSYKPLTRGAKICAQPVNAGCIAQR